MPVTVLNTSGTAGLMVVPQLPGPCGVCGETKGVFINRDGRSACLRCALTNEDSTTLQPESMRVVIDLSPTQVVQLISCERKDGYSYAEAQRIAKRIRRDTDDVVVPYHCKFCRAWHVGTNAEHILRKSERKRRA